MRSRPTQKQVAEEAGVSQTVVSQVLNGQGEQARINPETRARVQKAIQTLGYVPNAAARRLVGGSSSLLGVFTYEAVFPTSTRDFYAPFLEGIEQEAARLGFDLLLYTGGTGKTLKAALQGRLSLTDGTVLLGNPNEQDKQELAAMMASGHPMVFIGRRDLPEQAINAVQADYFSATADLVRYLQNLGHQQFWYVGQQDRTESAIDREEGFLSVISGGSVLRIAPESLDQEFVERALECGVRAFLVENDKLMRRLMEAGAAAGLYAPADFSAAVLGDAISTQPIDAEWTGFSLPRVEMGQGAVALLAHQLNRVSLKHPQMTFPCLFHAGRTVGPAPKNP